METKEYESMSMNMRYTGVNKDPAAFFEIDHRYKEALAEIEARRGRR